MDLKDVIIGSWQKIATDNSEGEGLDEHWEVILPEAYDIMANEIFLTQHRHHIDESMNCCAAEVALTLPMCHVDDIDDAKLYLHCLVRWIALGIADNSDFQAYVDSHVNGVIIPMQGDIINSQHIGWAKLSRLWLPLSEGEFVQISGALVERFKQYLFAEHCWHELASRHVGKELNKDVFALLIDSELVTQKYQDEAYQRLSELSSKVTNGLDGIDSLEPMQNWLTKLLALPRHTQLKKIGATLKAIRQGAIDMQRKGGECKPISLDEEKASVDSMVDESVGVESEELIDKEFLQLLSTNREKIEGILHRNAKIGKRRFGVMEMLTQTPTPTPAEIARQLESSDQTIARDIVAIQQSWDLIQEAILS